MPGGPPAEDSQPIFARHTQVEKEDVRFELGEHVDTLVFIRGLAHNFDVVLALEKFPLAVAEDLMVIRHEDADRLFQLNHITFRTSIVSKR
jgi:hypothetical protein